MTPALPAVAPGRSWPDGAFSPRSSRWRGCPSISTRPNSMSTATASHWPLSAACWRSCVCRRGAGPCAGLAGRSRPRPPGPLGGRCRRDHGHRHDRPLRHHPPIAPLLWFALTLAALSAPSPSSRSSSMPKAWPRPPASARRDISALQDGAKGGSLIGVCIAAVAPVALAAWAGAPFAAFAALFVILALIATLAMRSNGRGRARASKTQWQPSAPPSPIRCPAAFC
jgi:hypothetical protein